MVVNKSCVAACLRVARWLWNQWPDARGTGGQITVESVARCSWNGWSDGRGIPKLAVRFILSRKADEANNQQVELRLEEQVEGTSHFTQYKATRYTIRRSFTSEFDF
ncbi:hypothetical protein [Pseudomonas aeruginosa]|uniref:hypothetical protein n=1 Tax=Pseudomonas aeruginosa TaxID=287 RepID=UPI002FE259D2